MSLLPDKEKKQVIELFEKKLKQPIKIINFTMDFECDGCKNTREIMEELSSLSDKIELEVKNFVADADLVTKYEIARIPATVILGENDTDYGVRFYGVPGGYEFTSLIEAITSISAAKVDIDPEAAAILDKVTEPIHIEAMVLPTCPYCPQVVRDAHKFAIAYPNITADMIEVGEFPDVGNRYEVSTVPKVVINEVAEFTGAVPEKEFAEYIAATVNPELAEEMFERQHDHDHEHDED
jgi:glutaredoxin-like protein